MRISPIGSMHYGPVPRDLERTYREQILRRELKEKERWLSLRSMGPEGERLGASSEAIPGPRDWSPRFERGLLRLGILKGKVPPLLLAASVDVAERCHNPQTKAIVKAGAGFVMRVDDHMELVYVAPTGKVMLTVAAGQMLVGGP